MPTYQAEVCRVSYGFVLITVDAQNKKEAMKLIEAKAGDTEFSERSVDYKIDGLQKIKGPADHHLVKAESHSDDRVVEVDFDAASWLRNAHPLDIIALARCGWGLDNAADSVAQGCSVWNSKLGELFKYLEMVGGKKTVGYECTVDEQSALTWLKANRPDVHKAVDAETFKCGNCEEVVEGLSHLLPIADYEERVDMGGPVPSGECPHCGCLVYSVEVPNASNEPTTGTPRAV